MLAAYIRKLWWYSLPYFLRKLALIRLSVSAELTWGLSTTANKPQKRLLLERGKPRRTFNTPFLACTLYVSPTSFLFAVAGFVAFAWRSKFLVNANGLMSLIYSLFNAAQVHTVREIWIFSAQNLHLLLQAKKYKNVRDNIPTRILNCVYTPTSHQIHTFI